MIVTGTSFRAEALRIGEGASAPSTRALPEEVPVALVYDGSTQAVMMATPADLEDFAVGFSLTEGIVTAADQIEDMSIAQHDAGIEVRMWLASERGTALTRRRRAMTGPVGCGLCGIDSLREATRDLPHVTATPALTIPQITGATDALRDAQPLHDETRAVHAAGFVSPDGLIYAREDVGRHNALDKVIGALARQGIDPATGAFVLTSRVSIELVQKTALAGCGMLIAVSSPTAHALRLAQDAGITLVALAKGGTAEVFTHPTRIEGAAHVA
ncbi:formate dehydrogenase accessory sulfurtransferase FdhD [Pseudooceanicola sp. MF1-13]|uniref:formate dehydrogenase accessory sulfurtransferase FdhD n=1 Tax=Pseudooceanicola sp. MF1-13 TaxID=3379095 RepID=UPI003891F6B8